MEPLALKSHHLNALDGLAAMHFATNRQLTRFAYAASSYTLMTQATKHLVDAGYLRKTPRILKQSEQVFYLASKGRAYLTRCEHPAVPPAVKNDVTTWLFQEHTLAINEIFLYAKDLTRRYDITLPRFQLDRDFKRRPMRVPTPQGVRAYVPDAWCELRDARLTPPVRSFLFEVDRGTEEEEKWRAKIRTILYFFNGPIEEHFGTKQATVAIWVNNLRLRKPGLRMQQLKEWTRRELSAQHASAWGSMFLFSSLDPSMTSAERFFLTHRWQSITNPQGEHLLTA